MDTTAPSRLKARTWNGKDRDDYCCPNGTSLILRFATDCLTTCQVFYSLEECDLEAARCAEGHPGPLLPISEDAKSSWSVPRVIVAVDAAC